MSDVRCPFRRVAPAFYAVARAYAALAEPANVDVPRSLDFLQELVEAA